MQLSCSSCPPEPTKFLGKTTSLYNIICSASQTCARATFQASSQPGAVFQGKHMLRTTCRTVKNTGGTPPLWPCGVTAWRTQLLANRFAAKWEAVTIQTFPPIEKLEIGVFSMWVAKLLIPPADPYPVNLSWLHSRASQRGAAPQPSGTRRTVGRRMLSPQRLRAQGMQAPSLFRGKGGLMFKTHRLAWLTVCLSYVFPIRSAGLIGYTARRQRACFKSGGCKFGSLCGHFPKT